MSAILTAQAHALGAALATPRPPGWTDLGSGDWSWLSKHGSVTAAIRVRDDGTVSAPHIAGFGRFWLVASELECAMHALTELLEYLRVRMAWEAR